MLLKNFYLLSYSDPQLEPVPARHGPGPSPDRSGVPLPARKPQVSDVQGKKRRSHADLQEDLQHEHGEAG